MGGGGSANVNEVDENIKIGESLEPSKHIKVVSDGELDKIDIAKLRKALPADVFVKNVWKALAWLVWDMSVVVGLHYVIYQLYLSGYYLFMLPGYLFCGFYMSCLFVVGHDCGHGTFSDSEVLNIVCGMFTHCSLLVPFSAWARSHRFHHLHHNHVVNDYSFLWATDPAVDEQLQRGETCPRTPSKAEPFFRACIFPIFGWFFYLILPTTTDGIDGNHFLPRVFKGDRLWHDVETKELLLCWISTLGVVFYIYAFTTYLYDGSFIAFLICYMPSWLMHSFHLFTVTYLQHHDHDTAVYDNSTWSFTLAAFETTDRQYGKITDFLQHRIADCHVIHHLFFTKIPHYNLRRATDALEKYMRANGLSHLYRCEATPDWWRLVFKKVYNIGNNALLVTKNAEWLKISEHAKQA